MNDQVLSKEQMQELEELGIDTSNASMCWVETIKDGNIVIPNNAECFYPISSYYDIKCDVTFTFTLQDILNIIQTATCLEPGCIMTLVFCEDKNYITPNIYDPGAPRSYGNTPLEAAFEMLKWCKLNNYGTNNQN